MEAAAALSRVESETEKAALATVIFGRAGTQLLPMLSDGKEGVLALMEEAKRLGLVMSEEDAKAAAALTDAWTRLASSLKMLAVQVGAALAPNMKRLADWVRGNIRPTIEWIKQNKELIVGLAKMAAVATATGAAMRMFGAVMLAAAGPGGWLTLAVGALAALAAGLVVVGSRADEAAEKFRALSDAQVELMQSDELKTRLGEVTQEIEELQGRIANLKEAQTKGVGFRARVGLMLRGQSLEELIIERENQLRALEMERSKLNQQIAERKAEQADEQERLGREMEKLQGEQQAAARAGLEQRLQDRLHQLRIQQIEDEEQRAVESIRYRYDQLRKEAMKVGADLQKIDEAEIAEYEAIEADSRRRREAEEKRAAEERAAYNADLDQQIARERIMATKEGLERDLALLELERKQAIEEARRLGADVAKVNELYDLKRQNLLAGEGIEEATRRLSARGTFSAFGLWGFGAASPLERTDGKEYQAPGRPGPQRRAGLQQLAADRRLETGGLREPNTVNLRPPASSLQPE